MIQLDAQGLACPLPLLKTKQQISKMQSQQVLEVLATDVGSWRDIPSYLEQSPHRLLQKNVLQPGLYRYLILCGAD